MGDSLFSHLVFRFSTSPENLATEALCFILNQSLSARAGFRNLLAQLNIEVPESILFATQDASSEDHSIPDLVGKGLDGNPILYAEAKFWAGLTENQPVTYLQRMEKTGSKALIFIAPAKRFPTLWPELQRRCADKGLLGLDSEPAVPEVKLMQLSGGVILVLISWRVLLNAIQITLQSAGEREMESNLLQLQGLCARMDETAFLPVSSEELTGGVGTRILQYHDIVDAVTHILVSAKLVSKKGLHAASSRGAYVQYMHTATSGYALLFSPYLWSKYASTPIWLGIAKLITPKYWGYHAEAREKLVSFELATPPQLFKEENTHYFHIPLYIKSGEEKAEVVNSIVQQFTKIYSMLEK